jgi:hypothetical protein
VCIRIRLTPERSQARNSAGVFAIMSEIDVNRSLTSGGGAKHKLRYASKKGSHSISFVFNRLRKIQDFCNAFVLPEENSGETLPPVSIKTAEGILRWHW